MEVDILLLTLNLTDFRTCLNVFAAGRATLASQSLNRDRETLLREAVHVPVVATYSARQLYV